MKGASHRPALLAGFLAAEAVLYAAFLTLDLLGRGDQTIWLKYAGVLLCLAVVLCSALRGGDRLTAAALFFTAGADAFLLVLNQYYAVGVLLFLCVQTCYLVRLRKAGAPAAPWLRVCLPLLLGLGLYWRHMAVPLNLLAALYFSQLLSNAVLAWTLPGPRWRLFALGLTLFVGCDLCVGLFNSGLASPALYRAVSVGMWAFYLPSQVLIALSALPDKEASHENQ